MKSQKLKRKNNQLTKGEAFEPPFLNVGDVISYLDEHGHHGPPNRKIKFKVIQVYVNRGRQYLFMILDKYRTKQSRYATVLPINKIKIFMRKNND